MYGLLFTDFTSTSIQAIYNYKGREIMTDIMENDLQTILIVDSALGSHPYYDFFKIHSKKKFNVVNVVSDIGNRLFFHKYIENLKKEQYLTEEISIHAMDQIDVSKVHAIFCGSDCGFIAYSYLMNKYFPSKQILNADIKSNKFKLYTLLKDYGLVKTNQILVDKNNYKLIREITQPSVLKPLNGNGGRDTYYVNDINDLSVIENHNDSFILMDKIQGEEYSVDFVSSNKIHKLNAVWKYHKSENHHHREEIDLVDPRENKELIDKIYNFLVLVFSAVQHKDGPTHSEVIVNDNGVHLIEVNFRLHGHLGNIMQKITLGRSQAIESFENFYEPTWSSNALKIYNYLQPLKKILLNNKREKHIASINWQEFECHSSVAVIYKHPLPKSGIIPISTSVQTTLGFVMMTNKNIEQFHQDILIIRSLKDKLCS